MHARRTVRIVCSSPGKAPKALHEALNQFAQAGPARPGLVDPGRALRAWNPRTRIAHLDPLEFAHACRDQLTSVHGSPLVDASRKRARQSGQESDISNEPEPDISKKPQQI